MTRIAACIEYDGSKFFGWQYQVSQPTVQKAVESAFSSIANHPVSVHCAGRTDTGVHACGQIIHFDTHSHRNEHSWVLGANSKLPQGVSVLWTQQVCDEFHARFCALSRVYRYVLINRRVRPTYLAKKVSWFVNELEVHKMTAAAKILLGKHDFSAFRSSRCSNKVPQKTIMDIQVNRHKEWVWIDVEADGFLHHMVRNIVGTLLPVGCGDQDPQWIKEVLESRDRTKAGITAPADGLYFVRVNYPQRFGLPKGSQVCRFW